MKMKRNPKYKYDLFLSHNKADVAWTGDLAARIEKEKWRRRKLKVFFSPWDIKPGKFFPREIEKALEQSRKVAIVMSPGGVRSTWVELERIVATYISIEERDERLIPLYLRRCRIPKFLQPAVYIDFREEALFDESYQKLVLAIKDQPLPRIARKASATLASSSLSSTPVATGGGNNTPVNKAAEKMRNNLRDLLQLQKEGLIGESITQEYQHALLDDYFKKNKGQQK
jgi:hypothetical protein